MRPLSCAAWAMVSSRAMLDEKHVTTTVPLVSICLNMSIKFSRSLPSDRERP